MVRACRLVSTNTVMGCRHSFGSSSTNIRNIDHNSVKLRQSRNSVMTGLGVVKKGHILSVVFISAFEYQLYTQSVI